MQERLIIPSFLLAVLIYVGVHVGLISAVGAVLHDAAMSPCQCRLAGGCVLRGTVGSDGVYDDGTRASDYDAWDFYVGTDERVPPECRRTE